jgi:hypothetical protein
MAGYAAIGFGTEMNGSDIIIVQMQGSKAPKILDCYGTGHVVPTLDDQ